MKYTVLKHRCIACGFCATACPEKAFTKDGHGKRSIVAEKCTGCGRCVGRCFGAAIVPLAGTAPDAKEEQG